LDLDRVYKVYTRSITDGLSIDTCQNGKCAFLDVAFGTVHKNCMNGSIQVLGYHGTSRENAIRILNNGFRVSSNDYDWLGEGVYFFQDAPMRALQWAK
jgi:hypothetical protein